MATNPARAIPGKVTLDLPGDRVAEIIERDSDELDGGKTVTRTRVADTLRRMEMVGTINADQKRAGDEFRTDFQIAHLHGIRPRQMERIDMGFRSADILTATENARRRIWADIEALGGIGAIGSIAVWDIVGREVSLQEWGQHRGWNRKSAAGIIAASLAVIVRVRKIA